MALASKASAVQLPVAGPLVWSDPLRLCPVNINWQTIQPLPVSHTARPAQGAAVWLKLEVVTMPLCGPGLSSSEDPSGGPSLRRYDRRGGKLRDPCRTSDTS